MVGGWGYGRSRRLARLASSSAAMPSFGRCGRLSLWYASCVSVPVFGWLGWRAAHGMTDPCFLTFCTLATVGADWLGLLRFWGRMGCELMKSGAGKGCDATGDGGWGQ